MVVKVARILIVLAVGIASALAGCSGGSASPTDDGGACTSVTAPTACPASPPSYNGEIKYVVANFCAEPQCHGSSAGVSVHDFTTLKGIVDDRLTFATEAARCPSAMGMPPAGYPQPTTAQRLDLVTWAGICKAPNN
jgi:hypothetical protein